MDAHRGRFPSLLGQLRHVLEMLGFARAARQFLDHFMRQGRRRSVPGCG
jgi:hypothetical protein